MSKLLHFIKNFFTNSRKKQSSLETLKSKTEKMKAELESLSEFELLLKELTKHKQQSTKHEK